MKKETFVHIPVSEEKEYYALSAAQKRVYVVQQIQLDGTGYNIPDFLLLAGTVDKDKMERTFKRLIRRHESLRTSFHMMAEEPVQRIHNDVEFEIEFFGRGGPMCPPLNERDFVRAFDLSKAPLLRVRLVREAQLEYSLMIDMHHIITDGTSIKVLLMEFAAVYGEMEPEPLKLQYKDYSEWQNSEEQRLILKKQEEYWVTQFEEDIPVLQLPTDFQRPAIQGFEGGLLDFELPDEHVRGVKQLVSSSGATLYMVLLAVYTILLSKVSGQEDIVVGTPIAARRHADLEQIIGMFVNTLAIRNYPGGEKKFPGYLSEVKERTLSAFENQEYQFEDLVDRVGVNRDASRNPLFDAMFALQNMEAQTGDIPDVEVTDFTVDHVKGDHQASKCDLNLACMELGDQIKCSLQYYSKLFTPGTIERLRDYFLAVLSTVIADSEVLLSDITIISEEEKKRILNEFNDTVGDYPEGKTIHGLFEDRVEKVPERIALVAAEETGKIEETTYGQLNERSNRLAHLLREKGVAAGSIVAIMIERSLEMVTGIFGILKAGCAYLPIEPGYPEERVGFMLRDSGAKAIVTNGLKVRKTKPGDANQLPNQQTNLAYILYTSGSTGKPKGVMIEHGSVVNVLDYLFETYPFSEGDTYLFKTSYMFDVSVSEIFGWYL
ncbi:MAG: AMP-binding protein, partial [bacterium]|nr:AMP-binding protein [bacterium]